MGADGALLPRRVRPRVILGLISDTHGLVRPDVASVFAGVDLILHAGDVGGEDVLFELASVAPVEAVRGNVDPPGLRLPLRYTAEFERVTVTVTHGHEMGSPTPNPWRPATPQG
jgi:putative phosphoesterase